MSVASLAQRLRMSEGQLYTAALTLLAGLLLLTGLGNVHGVSGGLVAQPLAPIAPFVDAPVVVPGPVPAPGPLPGPVGLPPVVGGPAPAPAPEPTSSFWTEPPPPAPSPTPTTTPCDNQAVQDAGREVIETLDGASGGQLPEKDLLAVLGTVTGCDPTDPALLAVGLLVGAGQTLPDPGLPALPPLPYVEVPDAVVQALQPVRPAVDAVCGLVGTGSTVAALFVWAYPAPIPQTEAQVMFQALAACGQVRTP
jgi:hypothetical protein